MLILASTTDKLRLITGSAGSVHVHASWMDNNAGAIVPGRTNTPAITTATTTDIVPSPGSAAIFRNIKTLHVYNNGVAPNTVTVVHTDGTTAIELHRAVIGVNETLQYIDEVGFLQPGSTGAFTTGDVKLTIKTVADTGWVMMNDGTIGNAGTGASCRANADAQNLYNLLWPLPVAIYTGGTTTATTRGASAAADWGANKHLALPAQLGRALAGAGAGAGLTSRALGTIVGEETHTPTVGELAQHKHAQFVVINATDPVTNPGQWAKGVADSTGLSTDLAGTQFTGSSAPHNVMQPSTFYNVMMKL